MDTIVLVIACAAFLITFAVLALWWVIGRTARRISNIDRDSEPPARLADFIRPSESDTNGPSRQGAVDRAPLCCSFCGRSQQDVAKLIAGPTVFICDRCVHSCRRILKSTKINDPDAAPPPSEVISALDRVVRGHGRAKWVLAVATWRHARICRERWRIEQDLHFHTVLTGGTPALRKRLIGALADACGLPLISLDAPGLLASGDRFDALEALLRAICESIEDPHALRPCILYVDNIDRIGKMPAAGPFQRALIGLVDSDTGLDWEYWRAPMNGSSAIQLVCGGDFQSLGRDHREIPGTDLERFGLCQVLATGLPCLAQLDGKSGAV